MNENDNVNHPSHYTSGMPAIEPECFDFAKTMGFCQGNAFKYVWRAGMKKDAIEDLQKAIWYLRRQYFEDIHDSEYWHFYYEKARELASDAFVEDKLRILHLICQGMCASAIREIQDMIEGIHRQQKENKE